MRRDSGCCGDLPAALYLAWGAVAVIIAIALSGCTSSVTWPPARLDGRELHQCQWVPEPGGGTLIECCAWRGDAGDYRVICDTGAQ